MTFQDGRVSAAGDVAVAEGKTARIDLVGRPIGTLVVKGIVPADCGWRRLSVWEEGGIRKPGSSGKVAPGTAFGAGEGYVRVALVPALDECQAALDCWRGVRT